VSPHSNDPGNSVPLRGNRVRGQPAAFTLSKEQLTERAAFAAALRTKGAALNTAILLFNQAIEPLSQAVRDALADYNGILERARTLTGGIVETAQAAFDAKSEKWQASDKGIQVRGWIEQWEMSLDDVDLDLPERLQDVDAQEPAGALADASPRPTG
jgi:hypothetical protein